MMKTKTKTERIKAEEIEEITKITEITVITEITIRNMITETKIETIETTIINQEIITITKIRGYA